MLLYALSLFIGCDSPTDPEYPECDDSESVERAQWSENTEIGQVTAGGFDFGLDLLGEISQPDENIFFSPFSISTALGMVHLGAQGETAREMESVLNISENTEVWHQTQGLLIDDLHQPDRCEYVLTVANRVFGQTDMSLQTDFTEALANAYTSEVEELDFASNSDVARQHINTWVADNTEQKILDLFPQGTINPNTRLVLANAIYMNAPWANPFPKSNTSPSNFYLEDGSSVTVDMMSSDELDYGYTSVEKAQIIELDYRGEELKMVVILPHENVSVSEIEAELNMDTLRTWQSNIQPGYDQIMFPKFELRSKKTLNQGLIDLGMKRAFDGSLAEFSGITSDVSLFIETVIHEAWVQVDEGGTVAAAATGVSMGFESEPMVIEVNRPFVFLVQDRLSESVLFYGRVMNPAQSQ